MRKGGEVRTGTFLKALDWLLDVLEEFVAWTKKKKIKSRIAVADMLHVTHKEANRLLCLAALPDDVTIKFMKELMHGKD